MLTNIPFIAAWIIYYYATSAGMLFIALAMTGLTGGLLEAPVMTYVAEVTQPHLRGMLSATSSMSIILGIFTQMLGGKLGNWRTVSLVNLAYPLICFVALCLVPESPYWLAGILINMIKDLNPQDCNGYHDCSSKGPYERSGAGPVLATRLGQSSPGAIGVSNHLSGRSQASRVKGEDLEVVQ